MSTKKKKVYLVSAGSYSDYHIEAVFSTNDRAKLFASGDTDYHIEPMVLDDMPDYVARGYKLYTITFDTEGKAEVGRYQWLTGIPGQTSVYEYERQISVCGVVAKTDKQAIKIASEKRNQHLAEKASRQL